MQLVQILLPTHDNHGAALEPSLFSEVQSELTERFGGLTASFRSPAEGFWTGRDQTTTREDIVIFEVMVPELDPECWGAYRRALEERFRQEEVVVRATEIVAL
jgi:hypothetical protein